MNKDIQILRELAQTYMIAATDAKQQTRRDLWRNHNSFQMTTPPIYIRAFAWQEMTQSKLLCENPLFKTCEFFFRQSIFHDSFNDDFVLEPWITIQAVKTLPNNETWGVPTIWHGRGGNKGGAGVCDSPIKDLEDIEKLIMPHHIIDEAATARNLNIIQEAIGDIITIDVDRSPFHSIWNGDISTKLGALRGLEQIMWDMYDNPEWLHRLLAFMRDGILRTHEEAETAGDWTLSSHYNQAIPYAKELADPAPNSQGVKRDELWCFCASQETTSVGPEMFDEFMLQYQLPIMAKFGLVAYGCCEDLTNKISTIKQIPNLRRIAVSPMADLAKSVEQIGNDYIISYRPSPADMVAYDFNPERIRKILRRDFEICRGTSFDITLKDVETVQSDPNRISEWVKIVREVIEEYF
jgi:hypothetical protein